MAETETVALHHHLQFHYCPLECQKIKPHQKPRRHLTQSAPNAFGLDLWLIERRATPWERWKAEVEKRSAAAEAGKKSTMTRVDSDRNRRLFEQDAVDKWATRRSADESRNSSEVETADVVDYHYRG